MDLHCSLLKMAKLRAKINTQNGANFLIRECLGEAGFEVTVNDLSLYRTVFITLSYIIS